MSGRQQRQLAVCFMGLWLIWLLNGLYLGHLLACLPVAWLNELLTWILIPALCLKLLKVRQQPRQFGLWFDTNLPRFAAMVLFTCIVLFIVKTVTFELLQPYSSEGLFDYRLLLPSGGWYLTAASLFLAATPAIVEELWLRAILHRLLSRYRRFEPAFIILSCLLTGIIHWENGLASTVSSAAYGLAAAAIYLGYKSIVPLSVAHLLINLSALGWFDSPI